MNSVRRTILILSHRYVGIVLSILVAMWFASGIVMMYAGGMPRIEAQTRLERLPDLDLSRVRLTLAQAAEHGGLDPSAGWDNSGRRGGQLVLLSLMGRPAYRFGTDATVFADDRQVMEGVSQEQAQEIAAQFLRVPADKVHYERLLTEVDQWTLGQSRQMPQYQFAADNGNATEIYVQRSNGEVSMLTTGKSRLLAWLGTIPHWLYFRDLRVNQPLWYEIMVWTSAIACIVGCIGLILAVTQLKRSRRSRFGVIIPYTGWMRWHYISGAIFGVTTVTFAYSGLLSMDPFAWTNARGLQVPRNVLTGGALDFSNFARVAALQPDRSGAGHIKEIEFTRIQDKPYFVARSASPVDAVLAPRERLHQTYDLAARDHENRQLISADTLAVHEGDFSADSIMTRLKTALPETNVADVALLTDYDTYYYSRAGRLAPLPALRVKFDDPMQTWIYVDPSTSQIVADIHRYSRLKRWLYSGLHKLDFRILYDLRPLWDIVMIVLCLGGFVLSAAGAYLGCKRIVRGTRRGLLTPTPAAVSARD